MTPQFAHDFILSACRALSPAQFDPKPARAMLITIGSMESSFVHRQQLLGNCLNWWESTKGPAHGFWQFEHTGVVGVMRHHVTSPLVKQALNLFGYPEDATIVHAALKHNDVLAACFARLLLMTYPGPLPGPADHEEGLKQYLWCWRPGKPRPEKWPELYRRAWEIVSAAD